MSNLVTIHNLNGAEAITTTAERVIQELIALGELETVMQELVKSGALDRVIHLLNALKVMSVARAIDDKGEGYKKAANDYKEAYNKVVDMVTPKATTAKVEPNTAQRTDAKPCVHCGTKIVWLKSDGKSLPIGADSVQQGETVYNPNTHVRHMFSDCNEVKKANKPNKFTPPDAKTRKEQAKLF